MKVELSAAEQNRLDSALKANLLRKFLINREHMNFEVGDVLIKKNSRYDYTTKTASWVTEPISSSNKMAQRYVVIHKDEFGICFLKELKVSTGKLGSDLYCLADYDYDQTRFDVDPEYAERIFLDADFDIKDIHAKSLEQRKLISKMNRKTGVKLFTIKDGIDFFNGMTPGTKYYVTQDYTARYVTEYELVSLTPVTIHTMEQNSDYSWRHFKDRHIRNKTEKEALNENFVFKLKVKEGGSSRDRDVWSFDHGRDMVFFKTMPAQEEKK